MDNNYDATQIDTIRIRVTYARLPILLGRLRLGDIVDPPMTGLESGLHAQAMCVTLEVNEYH